jgi:hypothetical protein
MAKGQRTPADPGAYCVRVTSKTVSGHTRLGKVRVKSGKNKGKLVKKTLTVKSYTRPGHYLCQVRDKSGKVRRVGTNMCPCNRAKKAVEKTSLTSWKKAKRGKKK